MTPLTPICAIYGSQMANLWTHMSRLLPLMAYMSSWLAHPNVPFERLWLHSMTIWFPISPLLPHEHHLAPLGPYLPPTGPWCSPMTYFDSSQDVYKQEDFFLFHSYGQICACLDSVHNKNLKCGDPNDTKLCDMPLLDCASFTIYYLLLMYS